MGTENTAAKNSYVTVDVQLEGRLETHRGLGVILLVLDEKGTKVAGYVDERLSDEEQELKAINAWWALSKTLLEHERMPLPLRKMLMSMVELGGKTISHYESTRFELSKLNNPEFPIVLFLEKEGSTEWRRLGEDGTREWAESDGFPGAWQVLHDVPVPPGLYVRYMVDHGWQIWDPCAQEPR